jgi:hypothetical protein
MNIQGFFYYYMTIENKKKSINENINGLLNIYFLEKDYFTLLTILVNTSG